MQNLDSKQQILCPNCQSFIDINEVLYSQIFNKANAEFLQQKQELEKEIQEKKQEQEKFQEELQKQKQEQEKIIANQVNEKLSIEKQNLEKELHLQKQNFQKEFQQNFLKEHENEMKILQEELESKSKELSEFLRVKAENERLKREQKENEERLKFEVRQEVFKEFKEQESKNLELERDKMRLELGKESTNKDLKIKDLELRLEGVIKELNDAKTKAEQGSQQLQGEAGELVIEEYLKEEYLSDEIKEIPKGVNGADCLHIVKDNFGNVCGTILYESKRTKEFNKEWVYKLKLDSIKAKSDIAVLITKAMPKHQDRTHYLEGLLICNFYEFKSIACVLREALINNHKLKNALQHKDEKNYLLYEYLNSNEFSTQITLILKTYQSMKEELESEMNAMQKIWKKRAKAIEKLSFNSTSIVNSLNVIFSDLQGRSLIGEEGLKSLENLAKDEEND